MISNPKNGWCDFDLGDFHGHPSYLTDVAMDLVTACYKFIAGDNHYITVGFDEEGSEFILIADYYDCYIIEQKENDKDNSILHRIDINIKDLIKEIVNDIESDVDEWAAFAVFNNDPEEIKYNKEILLNMNDVIKGKIERMVD